MVAEHRMEPRLFEQAKRRQRVRPAVDQVADRQHAVPMAIEAEPVERTLQQFTVTVQIADDKVAPNNVRRNAQATTNLEGMFDAARSLLR